MGHSCEFRQFEGAGESAFLIAYLFYKSTHQNKTFCQVKTIKNKNYTLWNFFKLQFWAIFG